MINVGLFLIKVQIRLKGRCTIFVHVSYCCSCQLLFCLYRVKPEAQLIFYNYLCNAMSQHKTFIICADADNKDKIIKLRLHLCYVETFFVHVQCQEGMIKKDKLVV